MAEQRQPGGLRIVTFNNLPPAFQVVTRWAAMAGHTIALVVTTPGPASRRSESYRGILAAAPPGLDVLVTTRVRRVAMPLIRELAPDLILSFSFPYRLPPELCALGRYGAVNLHPTALPAYRGPNPMRAIYDGYHTLGATLHWTEAEFDTGHVLSQKTAPMPADPTPDSVVAAWFPLMIGALQEGVARAVAGEPGTEQDESAASYAAAFGDADRWLDWAEPGARLQQQSVALAMAGSPARAQIGGAPHHVDVAIRTPAAPGAAPGTVLDRGPDGITVACGDGAVLAVARPLDPA